MYFEIFVCKNFNRDQLKKKKKGIFYAFFFQLQLHTSNLPYMLFGLVEIKKTQPFAKTHYNPNSATIGLWLYQYKSHQTCKFILGYYLRNSPSQQPH